jgi:hypothetical protein
MTSSLTHNTAAFLASHAYGQVSGWVTLIVLALLLVLLVEREVARAAVRTLPVPTRRIFDVAAMPLLLTFAIVVIQRFLVLG